MYKKSLLLSAIFFDFLGKAAVFCVHKLKEKVRDPLPTVWRNRLRGRSPLSLRDISPLCGESPLGGPFMWGCRGEQCVPVGVSGKAESHGSIGNAPLRRCRLDKCLRFV